MKTKVVKGNGYSLNQPIPAKQAVLRTKTLTCMLTTAVWTVVWL